MLVTKHVFEFSIIIVGMKIGKKKIVDWFTRVSNLAKFIGNILLLCLCSNLSVLAGSANNERQNTTVDVKWS